MTSTDRKEAARELLDFYREAGVDALLEETPTDRFASDRAGAAPAARAEVARRKGRGEHRHPLGSRPRARTAGLDHCRGPRRHPTPP